MYRSYAFTVRPRNGVSSDTEKELIKWLSKQDYGYATIEMEDEARHMHGQVWYEAERARGNFHRGLSRICERTIDDWDPAQAKVLSKGTKIAYDDFYRSYLIDAEKKKDDVINCVYENIPDKTQAFYPSE